MNSPSRSNMSQEAVREFLAETQESLEQVESGLVTLEQNPGASGETAGVPRMFRILHSIKGTCGFLGYPKLEELAHVGENLLGRVRDGLLPIDATVVTALLSVMDAIREVLEHIEAENEEGDRESGEKPGVHQGAVRLRRRRRNWCGWARSPWRVRTVTVAVPSPLSCGVPTATV